MDRPWAQARSETPWQDRRTLFAFRAERGPSDSLSPSCSWLSGLAEKHERKTKMFDMHRVELDWGGRKLTLETGRMARQADGAVLATYGETTVPSSISIAMYAVPST